MCFEIARGGNDFIDIAEYSILETVVFVNSFLNPIVYFWWVTDLRRAAWKSLKTVRGGQLVIYPISEISLDRLTGDELVRARLFDLTVLRFLSEHSQVLSKKNNLQLGWWRSLCRFISSLARVLGSKSLGVIRKTTYKNWN